MTARWVGRFRELGGSAPDPSIFEARGRLTEREALVAADYLRNGHPLIDVPMTERDVIDGSPVHESASIRGDGVWIWREDLAHYVAKYRIKLDRRFMRDTGHPIPDLDGEALLVAIHEATELWQEG